MNRRNLIAQSSALASLPWLALPAFAQQETAAPAINPRVGMVAPSLMGRTLDKQSFDLSKDSNNVRLVAFWATWCPTCRVEMPDFRKAHEKWARQGFDLVTVAIDKKLDDVMAYDTIVDRTVPVTQRFAKLWRGASDHRDDFGPVLSTPTTYLIDRKQKVIGVFKGRVTEAQWALVEKTVLAKA
jgi:cytochrome c biogenesis protein CcmG, thiol:disulfide interchange protein DsbE